jgi:hypothetical protein
MRQLTGLISLLLLHVPLYAADMTFRITSMTKANRIPENKTSNHWVEKNAEKPASHPKR